MFIDQFIIVNNTEVKHFKCAQMLTTTTDLPRLLQTLNISNSLIAKKFFLLHNLKCIKEYGVPVLSRKHHKINLLTYTFRVGEFKPHNLCASQLLLLLCYCAKTDMSLPLQIAHILSCP